MTNIFYYDVSRMYPGTGVGSYSDSFCRLLVGARDGQKIQVVNAPTAKSWLMRSLLEVVSLLGMLFRPGLVIFPDERYAVVALFRVWGKTACVVHDSRALHGHGLKFRLIGLALRCMPRSVSFIAASQVTYDELRAMRFADDQRVIFCVENPIPPAFYLSPDSVSNRSIRMQLGVHLLYVGSFEPRKRVAQLLAMVRQLPDVRLTIVTSSFYARNCDFREHLGVDVVLDASQSDLIDLYRSCDAYITLSTFEGFGRCVIESQASGTPVIYTANNSTSHVLPAGGVELKDASVESLQCAIAELKANFGSLSVAAYSNALRFSEEAAVRAVQEVCKWAD